MHISKLFFLSSFNPKIIYLIRDKGREGYIHKSKKNWLMSSPNLEHEQGSVRWRKAGMTKSVSIWKRTEKLYLGDKTLLPCWYLNGEIQFSSIGKRKVTEIFSNIYHSICVLGWADHLTRILLSQGSHLHLPLCISRHMDSGIPVSTMSPGRHPDSSQAH